MGYQSPRNSNGYSQTSENTRTYRYISGLNSKEVSNYVTGRERYRSIINTQGASHDTTNIDMNTSMDISANNCKE